MIFSKNILQLFFYVVYISIFSFSKYGKLIVKNLSSQILDQFFNVRKLFLFSRRQHLVLIHISIEQFLVQSLWVVISKICSTLQKIQVSYWQFLGKLFVILTLNFFVFDFIKSLMLLLHQQNYLGIDGVNFMQESH